MLQILRFPSLSETQFLGCGSAFVDSLNGHTSSALLNLRKLEGRQKGAAFSFEMQMDKDRYGALIVLERWADCVNAFGPHLRLNQFQAVIDEAPARVLTAENLIGRTNRLIDASQTYSQELIAACAMAYETVRLTFAQEAEASASLGALAPPEFLEARRLFLADLAAR
jgi:quinol monooxygenase YgiN